MSIADETVCTSNDSNAFYCSCSRLLFCFTILYLQKFNNTVSSGEISSNGSDVEFYVVYFVLLVS